MLSRISPLISPELLVAMHRMGHGDEIVFADAFFPGHGVNDHVVRADGLLIPDLLEAVLPLLAIDTYVDDPLVMMRVEPGDEANPEVEASYRAVIEKHDPGAKAITRIDRHEFYDRSRGAFAVVMTGDTAKYANLLIRKGVSVWP